MQCHTLIYQINWPMEQIILESIDIISVGKLNIHLKRKGFNLEEISKWRSSVGFHWGRLGGQVTINNTSASYGRTNNTYN